jgi:hypothetical protein
VPSIKPVSKKSKSSVATAEPVKIKRKPTPAQRRRLIIGLSKRLTQALEEAL